ncbi:MAG: hypothetical protein PHP86_10240 [Nevskiales bacterium]|nr:hypothetical protein [Nevskiales bacterium]
MQVGLRGLAGVLLGAALAGCDGSEPAADAGAAAKVDAYAVDTDLIDESSGLARSQRAPDLLWTHNDSGGAATAYAVDVQGHYQGSVSVSLAVNLDWEDMSSFVEDGQPRLLLADVGDNGAFRPLVTLYVVDEPDVATRPRPFEVSVPIVRTISLIYPDGARDVESVAVDAGEGWIYLLSKRDEVPQLYRVPLVPVLPLVIAEALGPTTVPRAPADTENPERINWTTSMDFDADAMRLAVVTLSQLHVYRRAPGQSWADALSAMPQTVALPDYPQVEAVAWSGAGDAIWITSEGTPAPLVRLGF